MRKTKYSSILILLIVLALTVYLIYKYNDQSKSSQQNTSQQDVMMPVRDVPTLDTLSYKKPFEIRSVPSLKTLTSTCFINSELKYLPFVGDEPNVDNIDEYSSDTKCGYSWLGEIDKSMYDDDIVYRVKTLTSINLFNNGITNAQGWKLEKWNPETNQFITTGDTIKYGDKVRIKNLVDHNSGCSFKKGKVYLAHGKDCDDVILDNVKDNVTYFTIKSPLRREDNTPVFKNDPIILVVNGGNTSLFGGLPATVNLRKSRGEAVFGVEGLFDVKTLPTSRNNQNSWWKLN